MQNLSKNTIEPARETTGWTSIGPAKAQREFPVPPPRHDDSPNAVSDSNAKLDPSSTPDLAVSSTTGTSSNQDDTDGDRRVTSKHGWTSVAAVNSQRPSPVPPPVPSADAKPARLQARSIHANRDSAKPTPANGNLSCYKCNPLYLCAFLVL